MRKSKIIIRLFPIFTFLNSTFWLFYLLGESNLPELITRPAELLIIFGHLAFAVALFNEFSEYKQ